MEQKKHNVFFAPEKRAPKTSGWAVRRRADLGPNLRDAFHDVDVMSRVALVMISEMICNTLIHFR